MAAGSGLAIREQGNLNLARIPIYRRKVRQIDSENSASISRESDRQCGQSPAPLSPQRGGERRAGAGLAARKSRNGKFAVRLEARTAWAPFPRLFAGRGEVRGRGDWPRRRDLPRLAAFPLLVRGVPAEPSLRFRRMRPRREWRPNR